MELWMSLAFPAFVECGIEVDGLYSVELDACDIGRLRSWRFRSYVI